MKRCIALMCLVAFAVAGCAGLSGQMKEGGRATLPDGKLLVSIVSFTEANGSQMITEVVFSCDPDKTNSEGQVISYKNCSYVTEGRYASGTPGFEVLKAALNGAVAGLLIGGGLAAQGALVRPAKVSTGGASATATGQGTANSGSLTTGTVTGGSTVSGPNVGK